MIIYKGKVRLNSNVNHEVWKEFTVPELIVLRIVHSSSEDAGGHESVVDIKATQQVVDRTDAQERARLHRLYGDALRANKMRPSIDAIFGVGMPLPQIVDGITAGAVVPDKPIKRVKLDQRDPMMADIA